MLPIPSPQCYSPLFPLSRCSTNIPQQKLVKDEFALKEQCDKLQEYQNELTLMKEKSSAMTWAESWAQDSFMTTGEALGPTSRLLDVQEAQEMHGFSGQLIGTISTDRMMSLKRYAIHHDKEANAIMG